jgi:Ca-activated chloride channel family protein
VTFLEPTALLLLLLVPALAAGYVWMLRRREADADALGTMGVSGRPRGWRRHATAVLVLLGVSVLIVGLARPQATIDLPHREGTVILAFDVSSSMKAKDLKPSRMSAAKQAARSFVAKQPSSIRIGVVAFSDTANVVQPPTRNKADVLATVNRLKPRGGTALGRGILTSIGAIAGKPITLDKTALEQGTRQPGVKFLGASAVVLLSDGDNTAALDPLAIASIAAQAGVRVFPVGIGSPNGATVEVDGVEVATALNPDLLRKVADTTHGAYIAAPDVQTLQKVYNSIDLKFTIQGRNTEVTALFAGAGLLLLIVAAALSMFWHGRVI